MGFATVAIYASMIVWILPLFRQYKTRLFYYFLILGLADPVAIVFFYLFNIDTLFIHSIVGILLFYFVDFERKTILKDRVINLVIIAGFITALFTLSNLILLIIICHFLILLKFIKHIIIGLYEQGEVNTFYLILVFYELTILVNLIAIIGKTDLGYLLHYLTVLFDVLVAVFFTILRSDSKRLVFSLKPVT